MKTKAAIRKIKRHLEKKFPIHEVEVSWNSFSGKSLIWIHLEIDWLEKDLENYTAMISKKIRKNFRANYSTITLNSWKAKIPDSTTYSLSTNLELKK